MRSALAVAVALVAVGCTREQAQAPAVSTVDWAQRSADGRFEVRQRREGTSCRVQAVVKSADGDRTLWSTQNCLPTPSGLAYLSIDGEKLLVLDLFPSDQAGQTSDWSRVPLVSLWVRGAVVRQYTGAEILSRDRVKDMGKVLSWLRGETYEDARRAARASADGEKVAIDLVDGRTLTLGFDGGPLPAPPASAPPVARAAAPVPTEQADEPDEPALPPAVPPPAEPPPRAPHASDALAADEQGLYRWEDDQGGLHFGVGAQVPARYRKRARPVNASVGVVPVDSPAAAAAPAAAESQPQRLPAQPQLPAPRAAPAEPGSANPAPESRATNPAS